MKILFHKSMNFLSLALVLSIFCDCSIAQLTEEDLIADAGDLGKIKGIAALSLDNQVEHIQFLGIPFANSVIGENRFKPSSLKEGPLNATGDTFEATAYGNACYQPLATIPMDEECLYLNVWTHRVNNGSATPLRPVILFIHGGGFTIGHGEMFAGSRIINRDVVFVNFNYRIGVLGFFCMENENAPGNAGMYDMITAMKWVQKYIHHFGGAPNSVTLAGQSAGSVAATFLMISPMANGLYHKVIGASGTVMSAWGHTIDSMRGSRAIAATLGCLTSETVDNDEVVDCMRAFNASTGGFTYALLGYQQAERREGRLGFEPVSPVVQTFDIGTIQKILLENPTKVFTEQRQANVSLLMGTTRHDGSYVLGVNYNSYLKPNNLTTDSQFLKTALVPKMLKSLGIIDESYGIYETIAKTYLGDARLTGDFDKMLPGLIDLHTVFFYKAASYHTALLHSEINKNVYWYSFDYSGTRTLFPFLFNYTETPYFPGGVTHTDDLIYLFPLTPFPLNDEEKAVSTRMLDYWTNFAEFGNPTPAASANTIWPALTNDVSKFLSINAESVEMDHYPDHWPNAALELFENETASTTPDIITTTTPATISTTPDTISTTPSSVGRFKLENICLFVSAIIVLSFKVL